MPRSVPSSPRRRQSPQLYRRSSPTRRLPPSACTSQKPTPPPRPRRGVRQGSRQGSTEQPRGGLGHRRRPGAPSTPSASRSLRLAPSDRSGALLASAAAAAASPRLVVASAKDSKPESNALTDMTGNAIKTSPGWPTCLRASRSPAATFDRMYDEVEGKRHRDF